MNKKQSTEKTLKFRVDLQEPVKDEILIMKEYVDFLKSNIKVNNKKGELGDAITVTSKGHVAIVTSTIPFSKRYLKYLTKKYLKKVEINEYLKVNATDKATYKVLYLKLDRNDEDEEN